MLVWRLDEAVSVLVGYALLHKRLFFVISFIHLIDGVILTFLRIWQLLALEVLSFPFVQLVNRLYSGLSVGKMSLVW